MLVNLNQHWAGTEDGEGISLSVSRGPCPDSPHHGDTGMDLTGTGIPKGSCCSDEQQIKGGRTEVQHRPDPRV